MKTLQRPSAAGVSRHINPHSPFLLGIKRQTRKHKTPTLCSVANAGRLCVKYGSTQLRPRKENASERVHCTAFLCPLTFVAISDRVKVHIILLVGEEKKAEPGVEGIDGHYEEDPDYVPLFVWRAVVT